MMRMCVCVSVLLYAGVSSILIHPLSLSIHRISLFVMSFSLMDRSSFLFTLSLIVCVCPIVHTRIGGKRDEIGSSLLDKFRSIGAGWGPVALFPQQHFVHELSRITFQHFAATIVSFGCAHDLSSWRLLHTKSVSNQLFTHGNRSSQ